MISNLLDFVYFSSSNNLRQVQKDRYTININKYMWGFKIINIKDKNI